MVLNHTKSLYILMFTERDPTIPWAALCDSSEEKLRFPLLSFKSCLFSSSIFFFSFSFTLAPKTISHCTLCLTWVLRDISHWDLIPVRLRLKASMKLCIMNVVVWVNCGYSLYCTSPLLSLEKTGKLACYNRTKSKGVRKSWLEMKAEDERWGASCNGGAIF